ncbi:ATP-grasp fold amidoligase family protein [Aerococcus urinaeequi]|uniref:ATP-grasp fold amidoligase family protein n=1 Tax=Aerococcus urinaeequi TaxID=51665 RepID=UPI003F4FA3AF
MSNSNNLFVLNFYHRIKRMSDKYKKSQYAKYSLDDKKEMLAKKYEEMTGEQLDWNNLQTYNEKMQWTKLYETNPIKSKLADKYLSREWVANKIGEEYLIPLLGVWDSFDEIDFSSLPTQFVLKTNNASGTNIIVEDKNQLDMKRARIRMDTWINRDFSTVGGFQMHYQNIEPKIIAEKYIVDSNNELKDYRFLCFDGTIYYCIVDVDHVKRNIYDLDWNLQNWQIGKFENYEGIINKPENFDAMINLVKILCQGFPHVRVDLYNVDGRIYFGEMTFSSTNGFQLIRPYSKNIELGNLWELKNY